MPFSFSQIQKHEFFAVSLPQLDEFDPNTVRERERERESGEREVGRKRERVERESGGREEGTCTM